MKAITEKELIGLVHHSMYQQWERRGYAAPVDTLIECGVLPKKAYEEWRFGKVPYLEKVCIVNLHKLSFIMHQMRVFAKKNQWTPSFCYYKQWGIKKKDGQGHKPVIPLRFSKSGEAEIERWYATHFVDKKKISLLKKLFITVLVGLYIRGFSGCKYMHKICNIQIIFVPCFT